MMAVDESRINEYMTKREELVQENLNLIGVILDEDEQKLDKKLAELKEEFEKDCDGRIPYDMPVLTDERIRSSRLYKFMKRLPKGADLHVHGSSLLPVDKIIDFLIDRDDMFVDLKTLKLVNKGKETSDCKLLKDAFYGGYISRKDLLRAWTVVGFDPEADAWAAFERLFDYTEALDTDLTVNHDYYVAAFRHYVDNNILHAEVHLLISEDVEETVAVLEQIRDAYYIVKKDNPDFVVSIICCAMKLFNLESTENMKGCLDVALTARERVKDESDGVVSNFILGFDLINEEDTTSSLKTYAPLLLEYKDRYPDFDFYLHCGESLEAENDNLMDAYLLGARRVGHGLNLYRYPKLLKDYADSEICLECCPISNQTLQYVDDLRLHPATEYLKRGVTVALCSDDPVFQENEALTDDFFAATVCWDLTLAELKTLCVNSVLYSGLDETRRRKLSVAWRRDWERFVKEEIGQII